MNFLSPKCSFLNSMSCSHVVSRLIYHQMPRHSLIKWSRNLGQHKRWFFGHYPSPLQDGLSYTDKFGHATSFTTIECENAVNLGLLPHRQIKFDQMFNYFTDLTLGQVAFEFGNENYCHKKHLLNQLTKTQSVEWKMFKINVIK